MALIEHGHGTLLFFQLRTSILTRLMRPGFDRRTARESWGQLNVKSPPPQTWAGKTEQDATAQLQFMATWWRC